MELKLLLQIVGTLLGLLYLWLEYKANIWVWIVGAIMPMVHGVLYLNSGIYADAAMQLYYVAAGIYGLVVWRRASKKKDDGIIKHTPRSWIVSLVAVYAVLHVAIYFFLTECTDSRVPVFDSMSTALSIVAVKMKKKHAVIFFILSFVCSMGMGYMASHDSTSAMVNWIEQGINCVGQGMMFVGAWTLHKNGLKEFALH